MLRIVKQVGAVILISVLGVTAPWVVAEGIYSLAHRTSLVYELYLRWFGEHVPQDPSVQMITDAREFSPLLTALRENGVGLGNAPFSEVRTDEAAINATENGCLVQKPNLHKTMSFLRSNLFNPFDQVTYFHDADRPLPAAVTRFFEKYGVRQVHLTTNEYGERLTLPRVSSPDKVLVAGDSIADGMMLDDAETMASHLQAGDGAREYINLGIGGATAADVVCALQRAAARYHGHIRRLIYVFCENDFSASEPYGTPEQLMRWLDDFRAKEQIGQVTFLYAPYIYNSVPELTRIRGHTHRNFPTFHDEKRRLLALARASGFTVVDFLDITNAQRRASGSQFAPLALYVDHAHPSNLGIDLLLPRLRAP
jgi:hypothetical protein